MTSGRETSVKESWCGWGEVVGFMSVYEGSLDVGQ